MAWITAGMHSVEVERAKPLPLLKVEQYLFRMPLSFSKSKIRF